MAFFDTPVRRRRSKKPLRLALRVHVIIAVLSIGVIAALGNIDRATFATHRTEAQDMSVQTIGIDNTGTASISIVMARKGPVGYVTVVNASMLPVHVSLPSAWQRVEVRGAPLEAFIPEKALLGLTRWSIPAGASMSLTLTTVPTTLRLLSTSDATAGVTVRSIDLLRDQMDRTTVLLKHSESTVKLWQVQAGSQSSDIKS